MAIIFVYGSLRKGYSNHGLMKWGEYLGVDSISGKNISTERLFAVIPGDDIIEGELYRVPAWVETQIDYLEGTDWGFYEKVRVRTHNGVRAFVYFLKAKLPPGFPQIEVKHD